MPDLHSVRLYKCRYVAATDIFRPWKDFGGIVSHRSLIGVLSHISVTDNPLIAMKYDDALNSAWRMRARMSTPPPRVYLPGRFR